MPKDKLRPEHTTIVSPDEYDVEKDIQEAVKLANDGKGHPDAPHLFILFDIGKLVGLYLAYKELKSQHVCPECNCEQHLTIDGRHVCRNESCSLYD